MFSDGSDQAGFPKRDHESADVLFGNLLGFGDVADEAGLLRLVDGEIHQDTESIASFGRDFHNL